MFSRIGRLVSSFALGAVVLLALFFIPPPSATGVERVGFTFSHVFARGLGLDWREAYLAALDDLHPQILRIPVYWDEVEKRKDAFDFSAYDFLVREAAARDIPFVLAIGMRVPRWPECHIPEWARPLPERKMRAELKEAIAEIVERYKDAPGLSAWQVENEPFLPFFGECPPPSASFLDEEIELVRFLDPDTDILITDSGELSAWVFAAARGDVFGTTMYRSVWSDTVSPYIGYFTYPFPPKFFWLKANIVHILFGAEKRIVNVELQAEPWGPEFSIARSEVSSETMDIGKLYDNIDYAYEVGFPDVYLWGVEWWYARKTLAEDDSYWRAVKKIIEKSRASAVK